MLQLKRDRFTEELESYAKQVEEFATYGEMTEVPRYLKKAQALDAKLQAAADKIDAFNTEEESFNWGTTAYPQRMTIINTLKPYLHLYEMTVDFNSKHKSVASLACMLSWILIAFISMANPSMV